MDALPAEIPPTPADPIALRENYLSTWESIAQTLGFMTPTGVLGVTIPLMIMQAGSGAGILFLLTLVIFFFLSRMVNTFASRVVSAGSLATFIQMGLGRRATGFAGPTYLIALTYSAAIAAVGSADYLDILVGQYTGTPPSIARAVLLTLLVLAAAWWTAYRDVKLSAEVMLYIEAVSLSIIVLLLAIIVWQSGAWVDREQFTRAAIHPRHFQAGLVFAFTALAGFESAVTLGEESRTATRTMPRVTFAGVMVLGIFFYFVTYLLVSIRHNGTLTMDDMANPFVVIAARLHLPMLGTISSLGVALSFFACALASLNAASRVLYAMARDGNFWPSFAVVHPRTRTPYRTLALLFLFCAISCGGFLLCSRSVDDSINYLSELETFAFISSYLLLCLAAPLYLKRQHILHWPTMVFAGVSLVLMMVVLVFYLFPFQPAPLGYYPLVFLALLALGICAAWLKPWTRRAVSS